MLKDQDTGSGVFTAEEADGIGDKGAGDITTVNVNIFRLENIFLYCRSIRISETSVSRLRNSTVFTLQQI
jgi:hypothetical protein